MTEENRTYITHLKVTDVPWHRLTTAYGRGTDFPAHLAVLEQMEDIETVKKSLYELTTNMEHPRRHTRCSRDWSSDVCSSDLFPGRGTAGLLCLHPPVLPRWG